VILVDVNDCVLLIYRIGGSRGQQMLLVATTSASSYALSLIGLLLGQGKLPVRLQF